jgi:hypothetical protein
MASVEVSIEAPPISNSHAFKKDSEGYYWVPVCGYDNTMRTLAGSQYLTNEIYNCMMDPASSFQYLLNARKLYGEWGHPKIWDDDPHYVDRMCMIDEDCIAFFIDKVESRTVANKTILFARIIPHGPKAEEMRKSLEDPRINTSFSVRAISDVLNTPAGSIRKMRRLITFDYVYAGGFDEASKEYAVKAVTNESFDLGFGLHTKTISRSPVDPVTHIQKVMNRQTSGVVTMEAYQDKEILDVMGAEPCYSQGVVIGYTIGGKDVLIDGEGVEKSYMHSLFMNRSF